MAASSPGSRIAAFFDMDKTVVLANTGRIYARHMRESGELSWRGMLGVSWTLVRYKLSLVDIGRLMHTAASHLRGSPESALVERCEDLFDRQVRPLVSRAAVEAIEGHRRRGHVVAMLSASTPYMVAPLCRHLGIDDYICTRFETREGSFTGDYVRPACYGDGKRVWAERFAAERGIDLDRSYFYTDSFSDLPMLLAVGHQRCVNPDPRLRIHATLRRWPVLRFHR